MVAQENTIALEDAIEQFERGWQPRQVQRMTQLLSEYSIRDDLTSITEFVRTDIELSYANGVPPELSSYFSAFSELSECLSCQHDIAFEDYRSRCHFGFEVHPDRWASVPQIGEVAWYQKLVQSNAQLDRRDMLQANDSSEYVPGEIDSQLLEELSELGFLLIDRLGSGRFGLVYLAKQVGLSNRHVVLKIVEADLLESQRLARLRHTHIVPIYSVHRLSHRSVLCMPYWGRTTLATYMKAVSDPAHRTGESLVSTVCVADPVTISDKTLDLPDEGRDSSPAKPSAEAALVSKLATMSQDEMALGLFRKLASALAHSHERGVMHCDIKPQNILVRSDGEPALFDFNLAQSIHADDVCHVGGTLPYLSPEACRALIGKSAFPDAGWDIYSLGVVAYEYLTGQLPYPRPASAAPEDLEVALRQRARLPSWGANDHIGMGVRRIIEKCLAFQPQDRYQTAAELESDLLAEAEHRPLAFASEPMVSRYRKWSRRHPKLLSSGIAALVLFGLMVPTVIGMVRARREAARLESARLFSQFVADSDASLAQYVVDPARDQPAHHAQAWEVVERYQLTDPLSQRQLMGSGLIPDAESRSRRERVYRHLTHVAIVEIADLVRRSSSDLSDRSSRDRNTSKLEELIDSAELVTSGRPQSLEYLRSQLAQLQQSDPFVLADLRSQFTEFGDDVEEQYLQAIRDLSWQRWRSASELLTKLADYSEIKPALRWTFLGRAQYSLGDYEAARLSFSQAIEHARSPARLRYMLGLAHFKLGKFRAAEDQFFQSRENDPALIVAWQNEILAALAQSEVQRAYRTLEAGLKLHPHNTPLEVLGVRVYQRLGDEEKSSELLNNLLARDGLSPAELLSRAKLRQKTDLMGAIADVKQAIELGGNSSGRLHLLAELYAAADDDVAATQALERMVELEPDNERALADLAVLLARQSRVTEARSAIQRALEPQNAAVVHYQAACTYALIDTVESRRIAVSHLALALRSGFRMRNASQDPDLASLQSLPGMKAINRVVMLLQVPANRVMGGPVSANQLVRLEHLIDSELLNH